VPQGKRWELLQRLSNALILDSPLRGRVLVWLAPEGPRHVAPGVSPGKRSSPTSPSPVGATAAHGSGLLPPPLPGLGGFLVVGTPG
jgi:hypothetical protein